MFEEPDHLKLNDDDFEQSIGQYVFSIVYLQITRTIVSVERVFKNDRVKYLIVFPLYHFLHDLYRIAFFGHPFVAFTIGLPHPKYSVLLDPRTCYSVSFFIRIAQFAIIPQLALLVIFFELEHSQNTFDHYDVLLLDRLGSHEIDHQYFEEHNGNHNDDVQGQKRTLLALVYILLEIVVIPKHSIEVATFTNSSRIPFFAKIVAIIQLVFFLFSNTVRIVAFVNI